MYYVIVAKTQEYNDEYYSFTDSDGGRPVYVTENETTARQILTRLNKQAMQGYQPEMHYADSYIDYIPHFHDPELAKYPKLKEFQEYLKDRQEKEYGDYDFYLPNDMTDEELALVMDIISIRFYMMFTVDNDSLLKELENNNG